MIPIQDEKKSKNFPIVTICLIIVNTIVFIWSLVVGFESSVLQHGFVPESFDFMQLSSYQQVFSSMFLHGGWLHLIGNMLFLYVFGDNIEDVLGKWKFLLVYLLCGVIAVFAQYITNINSTIPMIGASGAISGVMGLYLVLFPHTTIKMLFFTTDGRFGVVKVSAMIMLVQWFLFQLVSSVGALTNFQGGGVAFMAHVGGFVCGFFIAYILKTFTQNFNPRDRLYEFQK